MLNATVLVFYANASNQVFLDQLADEGKEIQRILTSASGREYEVMLIPEASIENVLNELNVPNRKVEIIHFSGHADSQSLVFDDTITQANELAAKLAFHPSLKLVFLNGCASEGQVKFFHEAGIPFVIATSRPIEDSKAAWLASQFYRYLTMGRTVEKAFEEMEIDSRLLKKQMELVQTRGLGKKNQLPSQSFEWGLYSLENVPDYRLPLRSAGLTAQSEVAHSSFLQKMILALKDHVSPINQNYLHTIDDIENLGGVSDRTILKDLLRVLPYPLGIRLQQINGKALTNENTNEYYRQLLYDYTFFFETLLHYTASIILCQIWQLKEEISPQEGEVFQTFVSGNRLNRPFEEYGNVISSGMTLLRSRVAEEELSMFEAVNKYTESAGFREAGAFFDLHKSYYWGRVRFSREEAVRLCYEAQAHLNACFRHFGFTIEHCLTSVRGIDVINFRHVKKLFANSVTRLVVSDDDALRLQRDINPMENKGILYFSGAQVNASTASLNLFPFLIDRNVFVEQTASEIDLYLFVGFCNDVMLNALSIVKPPYPCYYFVSLKNPDRIWRFNEQEFSNADLTHIDESNDEQYRQNHRLTNAGELKMYLTEFKKFFIPS